MDGHTAIDALARQPAAAPARIIEAGPPLGLLAELTHRCPLQCTYCSNPIELLKANGELTTPQWVAAFEQAADLGVLQIHLSGGEPTLRPDLEDFVALLARRGVYTNLITAGVSLTRDRVMRLRDLGLDHFQLSIQAVRPATSDLISHYKGALDKKREVAGWARAAGLPLTINAPVHRHNIDDVEDTIAFAATLDADRIEIANVQYYGWASLNKAALMPTYAQVIRQSGRVTEAQARYRGMLNIDYVTPDYYAKYPKPCMGGWARDAFMIAPDGRALPCHAAQTITGMQFPNVADTQLADIWFRSEAFNRFRGTDWMREPCNSCERKLIDFGGCRCQAMALTGDAANTDPACVLSPDHRDMGAEAEHLAAQTPPPFVYRRIGGAAAAEPVA